MLSLDGLDSRDIFLLGILNCVGELGLVMPVSHVLYTISYLLKTPVVTTW